MIQLLSVAMETSDTIDSGVCQLVLLISGNTRKYHNSNHEAWWSKDLACFLIDCCDNVDVASAVCGIGAVYVNAADVDIEWFCHTLVYLLQFVSIPYW